MTRTTMKAEAVHPRDEPTSYLFDNWFDPTEAARRERSARLHRNDAQDRVGSAACPSPLWPASRRRAAMRPPMSPANRHDSRRTRTLTGTFGITEITVPRVRLEAGEDRTVEWQSKRCAPIGGARWPPTH